MAIYSQSIATTVNGSPVPSIDIKAGSTNAPRLLEYGGTNGIAAQCDYGFGRPGNDGSVVQTTPVLMQAEDPADPAALTGMAVAWSTAPTVPPVFLRRIKLLNGVGWGFCFVFPRGIQMPASKGLVNWNITGSSTSVVVWAVVDE